MHSLQLAEPPIIKFAHLIDFESDESVLRCEFIEFLEQLMRLIIVNEVEALPRIRKPLILLLPLLLLLDYLLDRLLYLRVSRCFRLFYHQGLFGKETLKSLCLSFFLSFKLSQVSISRLNFLFSLIYKLIEFFLKFFPLRCGCIEFFVNTVSFLTCHHRHLTPILVIHRLVRTILVIFLECVDPKYPIGLRSFLTL